MELSYKNKTATEADIFRHLVACKDNFVPPLDMTVDLAEYAKKIFAKAETFEAWSDGVLVGLIAAYFNDVERKIGFITNVSLIKEHMGKGVAKKLMDMCIKYAQEEKFREISLEVQKGNESAIGLYKKHGFIETDVKGNSVFMKLSL